MNKIVKAQVDAAKRFLRTTANSLPAAYLSTEADGMGDAWAAVRAIARGDVDAFLHHTAYTGRVLVRAADSAEWSRGVWIEVAS